MFIQENRTKSKLKAGQPTYGVISTSDDPQLAEIYGLAGFDFYMLDAEHGLIDPVQAVNVIRACERLLKRIILSVRDWGRDCWCESGRDNTCGNRFSQQFGTLPIGYDHKYVYSHFGFNLKVSDMQAAVGVAQLEKFPAFVEKRKQNFRRLANSLQGLEAFITLPAATPGSDPSWFGFLITVNDGMPFSRNDIVEYLENNRIQTRNLFAGNMTRHPMFQSLVEGQDYRISGSLTNTDKVMNDSFWLGVYPGMRDEAIDYMAMNIKRFISSRIMSA